MLNSSIKRQMRQRAHHLKPVVLVGQHGLSAAVTAEIDRALHDHELIKIRFRGIERDERKSAAAALAEELAAEVVTSIGGTVVLYRDNPDKASDWSTS